MKNSIRIKIIQIKSMRRKNGNKWKVYVSKVYEFKIVENEKHDKKFPFNKTKCTKPSVPNQIKK